MDARRRSLAFLGLLLSLLSPLLAQGPKLRVDAAFEPAAARAGEEVTLLLTATVEDGWHAYGTQESINKPVVLKTEKLALGGLEAVGPALIPPGDPHQTPIGPSFPLPSTFVVKQKLRVPAGAAAADITVSGALDYQVCNETMCLPPMAAKFSVVLKVSAAAATEPGVKPGLQLEDDPKVTIVASFAPPTARAGETATLVLDVTVDERYHAYGTKETTNSPVHLAPDKLQNGGLELAGAAQIPPGERELKFGLEQWPLPHRFQVKQPLRVPTGTAPSTIEVQGRLDYQVCDENTCDLATEGAFAATLVVESGAARAAPPVTATADDGNPFGGSWWALILACIGGGLFALAMPCTYPMIPITFSFFTKQAEKRHGKVMSLAIVYGLGIIAMFVLVGVSLSTVIIDVVNHWVTNTVIGVLFFFFAFVLFGWVNLNPPQFLQRAAGKASTTGGLFGVFFMGATLVITSFTCTAPIVGSLIANVAKYGQLRVGIGMGIFGLTMALPFMVLSLMPTKVKSMPRSGEWMETLKVSLGFVELAAAFKFVSMVDFAFGWQVLPRELFLMLWAAIFGLWSMYLFGILRKAGTPNEGVGGGRMAGGMLITLLAAYFLFGALGNRLDALMTSFVPNYSNSLIASAGGKGEKAKAKHTVVYDDPDQALAKAKSEGKLLLYNFTGFN